MLTNIFRRSLLLILLFGIVRATPVTTSTSNSQDSEEPKRQAKAAEILRYMNTSVDPCEDFYEFTCGNYATHNPASKDVMGTGFFETLQRELEQKIKLIVASDDKADTELDQNVKHFYQSCMKLQSATNAAYQDKLKEIISEFGQMPALEGEAWREDNFDWQQTMVEIARKYGIWIFLEVEVGTDFTNMTMPRLYVSEQTFDLPKPMYVDENNIEQLVVMVSTYASNLEKFLGLGEDQAIEIAISIVSLDKALAIEMYDKQAGQQVSDIYVLNTIEEVHQKYAPLWDFKQLMNATFGSKSHHKIYTEEGYLENLIEILENTSPDTVANYIFYKLIAPFMVDLPETDTEKEKQCMTLLKRYFYKNLDNMVYRQYNTQDTEKGILDMWSLIKTAFHKELESEQLQWIHEDTSKYAVEKLNNMKFIINSYQNYNFTKKLGHLNLGDTDYVENLKHIMSSRAFHIRDNTTWENDYGKGLSTTAAYINLDNSIRVPVALLQPYSTWSSSFPNAYNFAVLGSLLSHELLHGYDKDGRTFDVQGNYRKWWDEDSDNAFNIRSKCFSDQYQQYIYYGQHLPEAPNQDENIADNGGVRLAYKAYLAWHENAVANKQNVGLESLPDLNYSHQQLFFISYGHLWCSDLYSEYRKYSLASDTHVPDKFRVIGPLTNFEEFSKQFNCPQGSGMNPRKKCELY